MMEEQSPKELEFAKCEITALNSSHAFISVQANANMGLSDHRHIVCTIPNSQRYHPWIIILDQPDYISFLSWRHSAAYDCLTGLRYFEKDNLILLCLQYQLKS